MKYALANIDLGLARFAESEPNDRRTDLQKKNHSLEFMRDHLHLRARSNTFGAMLRVRNAAPTSVREPALGAHEAVDPQAGRFGVCNSRADCREQGQGSSGGPHRGD